VGHPALVFDQVLRASVTEQRDQEQHGTRHAEAQAQLPSEGPADEHLHFPSAADDSW
jgi:hypothetical protein